MYYFRYVRTREYTTEGSSKADQSEAQNVWHDLLASLPPLGDLFW